jgi:DNA-binding NtrC family response regulator
LLLRHPALGQQSAHQIVFGTDIASMSLIPDVGSRRTSHMKPRILIVDDDEAITQQLFWTLSDDYDVITANDMQTAVRRATVYEPAVSILDLHLPPEVDSPEVGLRILEYIKAHLPDSKILVMTSANGIETRKACYAVGADEFLDKPFDTEKLLSTMRRMAPPPLDFA